MSPCFTVTADAVVRVTSERVSHKRAAVFTVFNAISSPIIKPLPYSLLVRISAVCIAGFIELLLSLPLPLILKVYPLFGGFTKGESIVTKLVVVLKPVISLCSPVSTISNIQPITSAVLVTEATAEISEKSKTVAGVKLILLGVALPV